MRIIAQPGRESFRDPGFRHARGLISIKSRAAETADAATTRTSEPLP
jgi:hypothetical protein